MRRFFSVSFLVAFLSSSYLAAKHPQSCGMFNGSRCFAQQGQVSWSYGPDVWYHYDQDRDAPQMADPPEWQKKSDPWSGQSTLLIQGPDIVLPTAKVITASVEVAIDLEAPFDERSRQDHKGQLLDEYPAFAVNIELIEAASDQPLVSERIDLSPKYNGNTHQLFTEDSGSCGNSPCVRRWKLRNGFQPVTMLVYPSPGQQPFRELQLVAWAANRLKGTQLKGSIKFRNAKIQIEYEHPIAKTLQAKISEGVSDSSLLPLDENLMNCRAVKGKQGIGGGYNTDCTLREGQLDLVRESGDSTVIYDIEYDNRCTGTPLSMGVLAGNEDYVKFEQGQFANATVLGVQPMHIIDVYGKAYTARAILDHPCRIEIKNIYTRASDDSVANLGLAQRILENVSLESDDPHAGAEGPLYGGMGTSQQVADLNRVLEELSAVWPAQTRKQLESCRALKNGEQSRCLREVLSLCMDEVNSASSRITSSYLRIAAEVMEKLKLLVELVGE